MLQIHVDVIPGHAWMIHCGHPVAIWRAFVQGWGRHACLTRVCCDSDSDEQTQPLLLPFALCLFSVLGFGVLVGLWVHEHVIGEADWEATAQVFG